MAETSSEEQAYSVFSSRTKVFVIIMASLATIFSPLTSTIYLPSLNTLAADYNVSSASINLTVTTYMILQGVAPMFFGDLADRSGRRPVYILAFIVYFFANLGLALQNSYAALMVLRAMQSGGSSATVAIGNGVVADVITSAERGTYIGWVQAGVQVGPALGPILGGILAQFLGWRAIFWFLLIASALYLVVYTLFVPETGRNIVGNGSVPPRGINKSVISCLRTQKNRPESLERSTSQEEGHRTGSGRPKLPKLRFPNPLKALRIIIEKDIAIILFFTSLPITVLQCVITSLPNVFKGTYGFNDLQIGLCYIPYSIGAAVGSLTTGKLLDYNYKRVARKVGVSVDRKRGNELRHFPIERARLDVAWCPIFIVAGLSISWGWILQAKTSLAGPMIVLFFSGLCTNAIFASLTTLIVDLYPYSPATVTAAQNLVRCLISAVGTAVIQFIINTMGLGWCFTFLGLLVLVAFPSLLVVVKWGPKWREERFLKDLKRKEEKREIPVDKPQGVPQGQSGGAEQKDLEAEKHEPEDHAHFAAASESNNDKIEESAPS